MPNALISAPDGATLSVPFSGLSPDPQLLSATLAHYMGSLDLSSSQSLAGSLVPTPVAPTSPPPPPQTPVAPTWGPAGQSVILGQNTAPRRPAALGQTTILNPVVHNDPGDTIGQFHNATEAARSAYSFAPTPQNEQALHSAYAQELQNLDRTGATQLVPQWKQYADNVTQSGWSQAQSGSNQTLPPAQRLAPASTADPIRPQMLVPAQAPAQMPPYSKAWQTQMAASANRGGLDKGSLYGFTADPTPYLDGRDAAITHYQHLLQQGRATPADTAQYVASIKKNMDALQRTGYFSSPPGQAILNDTVQAGAYKPSLPPSGNSALQAVQTYAHTQGQDALAILQNLYNIPQTLYKTADNVLQGANAAITGTYDEATGNSQDSQAQARNAQRSFDQTKATLGTLFGAQPPTPDLSQTVTQNSDDIGKPDPSALGHGILTDLALAAGTEAGGRQAQAAQQFQQVGRNVGAYTVQHPLLQGLNALALAGAGAATLGEASRLTAAGAARLEAMAGAAAGAGDAERAASLGQAALRHGNLSQDLAVASVRGNRAATLGKAGDYAQDVAATLATKYFPGSPLTRALQSGSVGRAVGKAALEAYPAFRMGVRQGQAGQAGRIPPQAGDIAVASQAGDIAIAPPSVPASLASSSGVASASTAALAGHGLAGHDLTTQRLASAILPTAQQRTMAGLPAPASLLTVPFSPAASLGVSPVQAQGSSLTPVARAQSSGFSPASQAQGVAPTPAAIVTPPARVDPAAIVDQARTASAQHAFLAGQAQAAADRSRTQAAAAQAAGDAAGAQAARAQAVQQTTQAAAHAARSAQFQQVADRTAQALPAAPASSRAGATASMAATGSMAAPLSVSVPAPLPVPVTGRTALPLIGGAANRVDGAVNKSEAANKSTLLPLPPVPSARAVSPGVGPSSPEPPARLPGQPIGMPGQPVHMPTLQQALSVPSPSLPVAASPGTDALSTHKLAAAILGSPQARAKMGLQPPPEGQDTLDASMQPPRNTGGTGNASASGGSGPESSYRPRHVPYSSYVVIRPETVERIYRYLQPQSDPSGTFGFTLSPHLIAKLTAAGPDVISSETLQYLRQANADNGGYGAIVLNARDDQKFASMRETLLHEPQHILQNKYPLRPDVQQALIYSFKTDPELKDAWERFCQALGGNGYSGNDTTYLRELPAWIACGAYRFPLEDDRPILSDEHAIEMFSQYADAVRYQYDGDAAARIYNAAPNMRRVLREKEGFERGYDLIDISDHGEPYFYLRGDGGDDEEAFDDPDEP